MADIKFPCPRCATVIECDELWTGHQLQCPACQAELTVPAKEEPPAPAAADPQATIAGLAKASSSAPKLSIGGAASHVRPGGSSPAAPQAAVFQAKINQAKADKKGSWVKYAAGGVVAIVFAVGGYYGYGYFVKWQEGKAEAAKTAAAPAVPTNEAPAEASAPKEPAMTPPLWTLNLDEAKIPKGKANGMIGGTNIVVDSAQFDKAGAIYLLRLQQGTATPPDYQVKIYLTLAPTESPTGHVWSITQDMKGKGVPQVVKLWKTNPKYAAQTKQFNTGYAMKLELGNIADGAISGKIFLALPDKEMSVVGGSFKATTSIAPGTPVAGGAEPAAVPTAANEATRAEFERRYGTKKK